MVKQRKMFFVLMMRFYFEFTLIFQSVVKLCFYERKLQVQEAEKYEEWKSNRPADRILEIGKTYSQLINVIQEVLIAQTQKHCIFYHSKTDTSCVRSHHTEPFFLFLLPPHL